MTKKKAETPTGADARRARGQAAMYEAMGDTKTAKMVGEWADKLTALDDATDAETHKEASRELFEFRSFWRQVRTAYGTHPDGAIIADVVTATADSPEAGS